MKQEIEKTLTDLTCRLIEFKTVHGNLEAQRSCVRFLADYLGTNDQLFFSTYTHKDQPHLIVTNRDTKEPDVMLCGHIDVVHGEDRQYRSVIKDGRIYGRGALDMKGGVAAITQLFRDFAQAGDIQPSLGLMITSDEEQGCEGARYLVHQRGWKARFLLIPEGEEEFKLVTQEKGVCHIKMTLTGTSAHAAYPWRGDNALEAAMSAYARLRQLVPATKGAWHSTVTMTQLTDGGLDKNQVPDRAEAILDVRYTEDFAHTADDVMARFQAVAPEARFELVVNGDTFKAANGDWRLRLLHRLMRDYHGQEIPFGYNHGSSDASAFAHLNIPAMTSGIVGGDHHGPGEYVEIQSVVDYYRVIKQFIGQWGGSADVDKADRQFRVGTRT